MITLKQFINLARMIQFTFACDNHVLLTPHNLNVGPTEANAETTIHRLYKGLWALTPYIVCSDGKGISVQTHHGAHCKFEGIAEEGPFSWYSESCNLEPIMAETNSEDLNQYGIDNMSDIEAWIESHGGIDIDATIKFMYDRLKK